jgi:hypothetical protein
MEVTLKPIMPICDTALAYALLITFINRAAEEGNMYKAQQIHKRAWKIAALILSVGQA